MVAKAPQGADNPDSVRCPERRYNPAKPEEFASLVEGRDFLSERSLLELLMDVEEGKRTVPFLTAEQARDVFQEKAFDMVKSPALSRLAQRGKSLGKC